jgi:hypothetical protein
VNFFIRRLRRLSQIVFWGAVWCWDGLPVCPCFLSADCADSRRLFFGGLFGVGMACLSALVFYPQIAQIRADYFLVGCLVLGWPACLPLFSIRRLRRLPQIIFWWAVWRRDGLPVCPCFLSADCADSRRLFFWWAVWCWNGLPVCPYFSIRRLRRFAQIILGRLFGVGRRSLIRLIPPRVCVVSREDAKVFYPQIAQIRADYFGEEGAVWRSKAQMGKCERGRFFPQTDQTDQTDQAAGFA